MSRYYKALPLLVPLLLLTLYGLFLSQEFSLVTADLGRHIRNGELFVESGQIPRTNYYSYTHPNFPTLTHHWGAGVIFYLLWRSFGFVGLHLFFIGLSLLTFGLFYYLAIKRSGLLPASVVGLLIVPLLLSRSEIRPEVFSYLLAGIFFWLMLKYRAGAFHWRWLLLLPLLEVLWVNLHIYFFLGPVIVATFLLDRRSKQIGAVLLLVIVATLVNPFGLAGAIAPLQIFDNYGYRVLENQAVLFLDDLVQDPNHTIFKVVFTVFVASFFFFWWRRRQWPDWYELVFAAGFSVAAWLQVRNFAIFALFIWPIMAGNIYRGVSGGGKITEPRRFQPGLALVVIGIVLLLTLSGELRPVYPYAPPQFGWGVSAQDRTAVDFLREHQIKGPIFNNYGIGGYLIFHLFPQERVFVDNRPEAYPSSFFQAQYIPMQIDLQIWQEQLQSRQFNVIVFFWRDYTPEGQSFLIDRTDDPEWAPVFADERVIIFLRSNQENQAVISEYEIPRAKFSIVR